MLSDVFVCVLRVVCSNCLPEHPQSEGDNGEGEGDNGEGEGERMG